MPTHRQPVELGPAPRNQQRALALDFSYPAAMTVLLPAAVLTDLGPVLGILAGVAGLVVAAVAGRVRLGRLRVERRDGRLVVVNLMRTWSVPVDQVVGFGAGRGWVGGLYSSCASVHVRRRPLRWWPIRLHALSVSPDQLEDLARLVVGPLAPGPDDGQGPDGRG
ncbi:MAG: hypothetical protein AB7L84_09915 [Acidimicrobiia bacterium]